MKNKQVRIYILNNENGNILAGVTIIALLYYIILYFFIILQPKEYGICIEVHK